MSLNGKKLLMRLKYWNYNQIGVSMIAICNRCGHLCTPSVVEGYKYECKHCDEDLFPFEVTEYSDEKCEELYIDYFNNFLTIECFAASYGFINYRIAQVILNRGRWYNDNKPNN